MAKREYQRTGTYEAVKAMYDELVECAGGKAPVPPPPRPSEAMGIKEAASLESMPAIAEALRKCRERRKTEPKGQLELRMTVVDANASHVRVRVASRIGEQAAVNGFIVFNREEWAMIVAGDYYITTTSHLSPANREAEWVERNPPTSTQ